MKRKRNDGTVSSSRLQTFEALVGQTKHETSMLIPEHKRTLNSSFDEKDIIAKLAVDYKTTK